MGDDDCDSRFEKFIENFQKTYDSDAEYKRRQEIFCKRCAEDDDKTQKESVNDNGAQFDCVKDPWADLTDEEYGFDSNHQFHGGLAGLDEVDKQTSHETKEYNRRLQGPRD